MRRRRQRQRPRRRSLSNNKQPLYELIRRILRRDVSRRLRNETKAHSNRLLLRAPGTRTSGERLRSIRRSQMARAPRSTPMESSYGSDSYCLSMQCCCAATRVALPRASSVSMLDAVRVNTSSTGFKPFQNFFCPDNKSRRRLNSKVLSLDF